MLAQALMVDYRHSSAHDKGRRFRDGNLRQRGQSMLPVQLNRNLAVERLGDASGSQGDKYKYKYGGQIIPTSLALQWGVLSK